MAVRSVVRELVSSLLSGKIQRKTPDLSRSGRWKTAKICRSQHSGVNQKQGKESVTTLNGIGGRNHF